MNFEYAKITRSRLMGSMGLVIKHSDNESEIFEYYLLDCEGLGFCDYVRLENPTKEEIQSWIDRDVELKKLFNTSGMLYRELNIKEKRETYTQEQLIELLASNGMLVKRPIVIQGNMIIIGNKVSEYEKLQK